MFDGAAAQFLAILEALSDSRRNLFPPHPPAPDESEICVVTSELFSAGLEILSGNSLKKQKQCGEEPRPPIFFFLLFNKKKNSVLEGIYLIYNNTTCRSR